MSCKANKGRPIEAAGNLGSEVNFLFLFENSKQAKIYPIQTACANGFLSNSVKSELFDESWIAPTKITADNFYDLRSQKDPVRLVDICQASCLEHNKSGIVVKPGTVVAMMTGAGKFGMFLVKKLTPAAIQIDACHILL
jgi:hypothetical protein